MFKANWESIFVYILAARKRHVKQNFFKTKHNLLLKKNSLRTPEDRLLMETIYHAIFFNRVRNFNPKRSSNNNVALG